MARQQLRLNLPMDLPGLMGPTPCLGWTWRGGVGFWPLGPLLPRLALRAGDALMKLSLQFNPILPIFLLFKLSLTCF
ncbi:hypothetical protein Pyn_28354 [Prunus yedoensis var. nudiflora]|uniref:Uncharacterized protein n=1 Tax=Prunus yedoensis var. nudiflora TaxID=2094558 RepID=A0A314YCW2_PRUYE|nr:hypothetical protein Pyn_28354 [Prunus yedoensis var. nudiflora]